MVTFMCWVPEEPNAISSNLTGVGNKKLSCHRETARRFVTLTFKVIENGAVLIDHTRLSNWSAIVSIAVCCTIFKLFDIE